MKKETDLSSLETSLDDELSEYSNADLPDDISKLQLIQLIGKNVQILSGEKKRLSDLENQKERLQLEKDREYHNQNLDDKKFKEEHDKNANELILKQHEQENADKRLRLDIKKHKDSMKLEEDRLKVDRDRLSFDMYKYEKDLEIKKRDQNRQLIITILGIVVPVIGGVAVYIGKTMFMKQCMNITYHDNGLVPKTVLQAVNDFDKKTGF